MPEKTSWGQIKRRTGPAHILILSENLPLTYYYKTPQHILPGWDTQLLGQEPAVSPFDWQSNKALLCYFTQHSLSLRFTLAPVHRGQAFGINKGSHGKELRPGNGGKSIYHKVNLRLSYLLPMNWYHWDYGQALKVIFSVCPGSEVLGGPCPWEWVCELQKEVLMLLARLTVPSAFFPWAPFFSLSPLSSALAETAWWDTHDIPLSSDKNL